MERARFGPEAEHLLATLEPYVLVHPDAHAALDLAPLGVPIPPHRRFDPTRVADAPVTDALLRLDAATFGAGETPMPMPRWVLFDCASLPGLVLGLGARAGALPDDVRAHYGSGAGARSPARDDDAFVPLSMWAAIRAHGDGAWFGHNLASANVLSERPRWPKLALLTKALGLAASRAREQRGATQWASPSLGLHLRFGPLELLAADLPAHSVRASLAYRLAPTARGLARALGGATEAAPGASAPDRWERTLARGDVAAQRALHAELERGARWAIVGLAGRTGTRLGDVCLARLTEA